MRKISTFIASAVLAVVGAVSAQAASIGLQFTDNGGVGALLPTEVAGVVPQANYNVNSTEPFAGSGLVSDTGAVTSAAFTATGVRYGTGGGSFTGTNADGNNKLVRGALLSAFGNTATVSFTGIPYASYDVYVYLASDAPGRASTISNGATTYYYNSETPGSSFNLITGTSAGAPSGGNYAVFSGLTASSLNLTLNVPQNGGLNAVQIVSTVPEPTTLGLGALAAGGLLIRRRRD